MEKLISKFACAFAGLKNGFIRERSIRLQYLCALAAITVGLLLHFTYIELAVVLGMCGLVIGLEYLNSAIEAVMDFQQTAIDTRVKYIKDLASAAVLVASICALCTRVMFVIRHIGGL